MEEFQSGIRGGFTGSPDVGFRGVFQGFQRRFGMGFEVVVHGKNQIANRSTQGRSWKKGKTSRRTQTNARAGNAERQVKRWVSEKRWKIFAATTCKVCCPLRKLRDGLVTSTVDVANTTSGLNHQGSKKRQSTIRRKHGRHKHTCIKAQEMTVRNGSVGQEKVLQ